VPLAISVQNSKEWPGTGPKTVCGTIKFGCLKLGSKNQLRKGKFNISNSNWLENGLLHAHIRRMSCQVRESGHISANCSPL